MVIQFEMLWQDIWYRDANNWCECKHRHLFDTS